MAIKRYIPFLILLIALLPRLYLGLESGVYPDEITWMVKGKEFVYALKSLNLDYFRHAWWADTTETYAIGLPVVILSGLSHVLFAGCGKYSLHLFSDIFASRLPIIIVNSLFPVLLYQLLRKSYSVRIALITSILWAINPVAIGLDSFVLHDSFLTFFSFVSVYTFYRSLKSSGSSITPGFFAALSFLQKPSAILIFPAWLLLALLHRRSHGFRQLFTNLFVCWLTLTLIWPGAWFNPLLAPFEYLYRQTFFAQTQGLTNYFLGQPTSSPPAYYYLFQFFFRLPESIIILFVAAVIFYLSRTPITFSPLFFFPLAYLVAVSLLTAKAGIRYAWPVLPWIYLAVAWFLKRLRLRLLYLVVLFSVFTTLATWRYFPEPYGLFYNQFILGPTVAQKYDMVGLCVGNKAALALLDQKHPQGTVAILGCSDTGNYHTSRTLTKNYTHADYIIMEQANFQQFPHRRDTLHALTRPLLYTVRQSGVITATIYGR